MPSDIKVGAVESIIYGGAASVIAVNFTHPIETVKTRMQVSGQGIGSTVGSLLKAEGPLALWKGIKPAWGRESLYSSIKIGGYVPIRNAIGADRPDASFALKFMAGSLSGGIGSAVGNPFDVMKTIMQANKGESKGMMTLAGELHAKEGVSAFYRGVQANVMRACVLNGTKMSCYDKTKSFVVEQTGWTRKDLKTSFSSATVAGFAMTCTVAPFDRLRTLLMNQPPGEKLYNGFVDCLVKTVKNEGPLSLWRGFIPIWARFAPSATLQLLLYEACLTAAGYKGI